MTGWEFMDKIKEEDYAFLQNCTIFIISSSSLDQTPKISTTIRLLKTIS